MSTLNKSLVGIAVLALFFAIGRVLIGQGDAPRVLATGRFHQVAHKGKGLVTITRTTSGKYFLRLTDFRTSETPGLSLILISAPDAFENNAVLNSRVLNVDLLQKTAGDQTYELPDDFDVQPYNAVTIWNQKYQVNFTTAPLRKF